MKTITDISNDANTLQEMLTKDLRTLGKTPDIDYDRYRLPEGTLELLSKPIEAVSNESLTTTQVGGSGTFDTIMLSISNHLKEEFENGRITGSEYSRAYIELTTAALSSSIEFLVQRDQVQWAAITAQIQASTAMVQQDVVLQELDIKRVESELVRVNYATEKAKLSQLQTAINSSEKELELMEEQLVQAVLEHERTKQETLLVVDQQTQTIKTVERLTKEIELMDSQILQSVEQLDLIKEQVEAARGQTSATRRDGQPIVGVIGSQVDLQKQQKITFQKDMELKAAKVFSDAWTVMKSIDEGLTPPDSFSNENVDRILRTIA